MAITLPGWRTFIFGEEVSDDMSDVTWTWTDQRTPDTLSFSLSSINDRYIVTSQDIHAIHDDIPLTQDELDRTDFSIVAERLRSTINDPVKKRVLLAKYSEGVHNRAQPLDNFMGPTEDVRTVTSPGVDGTTSLTKYAEQTGSFLRFPFYVGHAIFHTGDHVRLFLRDPYKSGDWYFGFTGFVTNWQEEVDTNGGRRVRITVQCPLRILLKGRVVTNWSITDEKVFIKENLGDIFIRSWRQENLPPDLTLQQIIYLYVFGSSPGEIKGIKEKVPAAQFDFYHYGVHAAGPQVIKAQADGCGVFNREDSKIFLLGEPKDVGKENESSSKSEIVTTKVVGKAFDFITTKDAPLEEWQRAIDHKLPLTIDEILLLVPEDLREQEKTLLYRLQYSRYGFTSASLPLDPHDVMTRIGEHPEIYPCDFGRLMMLLPASLRPGDNRDLLLGKATANVTPRTEFLNRLQKIYAICERIDFSFYASPRGDLILEMPLYGFAPADFGSYADRYRFKIDDTINFSTIFAEEKVRTFMFAEYQTVANAGIGQSDQVGFKPAIKFLQPLIPMFGIQVENAPPFGFLDSESSASYYVDTKLGQTNANAWTNSVTTRVRLGLGPNRPCYYEMRDFIATTRSTGGTIVWGKSGSMSQTTQLNYHRGWSGQIQDNKRVYEFYGGMAAQPINYAKYFGFSKAPANTKSPGASQTTPADGTDVLALYQSNHKPLLSKAEIGRKLAARQRIPGKYAKPHSSESYAAFGDAYTFASQDGKEAIPVEWVTPGNSEAAALQELTKLESGGYTGRPNFLTGAIADDPDRWDAFPEMIRNDQGLVGQDYLPSNLRSQCTGIGQLNKQNAILFQPDGLNGYGDPVKERVGMMRYIKAVYGSPSAALATRQVKKSY